MAAVSVARSKMQPCFVERKYMAADPASSAAALRCRASLSFWKGHGE